MEILKFIYLITTIFINLSIALPIDEQNWIDLNYIDINPNAVEDNEIVIDLSHLDRSIYGVPDNETTNARVGNYNPDTDNVNPEELGSYLEGDMLIPSKQGRNGMLKQSLRWPNGIVPFKIDGDFNAREMDLIERGINEYHAQTCIQFIPRTTEEDYIVIENDDTGCWSSVGKIGGPQQLNLQSPGCVRKIGTFLHEMMHALGFLHEQNRHERDQFIKIQWDNIKSEVLHNFDKASSSSTTAFGVAYDYGSIMHYSAYAFSSNGQQTIIPKQSTSSTNMGQRDAFTSKDLQKINHMYKCSKNNINRPAINNPVNRPRPNQSFLPNQSFRPETLLNPITNFFGGLMSLFNLRTDIIENDLLQQNNTYII